MCFQEFSDSLKVVKVEADPNPGLVEKFKVQLCPYNQNSKNTHSIQQFEIGHRKSLKV